METPNRRAPGVTCPNATGPWRTCHDRYMRWRATAPGTCRGPCQMSTASESPRRLPLKLPTLGGWLGGSGLGDHPLAGLLEQAAVGAHPVAFAADVDHHGVAEQAVQDGGGDGVVLEDLAPGGK